MVPKLIYMTVSSEAEAEKIGRALVEERLAACTNHWGGMTSIYHWEGKLEQSKEVVLVAKTRANLVEPLINRVKELHSYAVPCVLSLPIEDGSTEYLHWIQQETGG